MLLKFCIFLIQYLIICNLYDIADAKSLAGTIRHAHENENLFVVPIVRVNRNNDSLIQKICIGSMISQKDVLTAAHCLEQENVQYTEVITGSIHFYGGTRYKPLWWMLYAWWAFQNGVNSEFDLNDIAIIRLHGRMPQNVVPIPISQGTNDEYYGATAKIASFSSPSLSVAPTTMDVGEVTVLSNRECNKRCKKYLGKNPMHPRFLCSRAKPFVLLDMGDSGGPIFVGNTLIGINNGFCPPIPDMPAKDKVNIHLGIEYYRAFILHVLRTN